MKVKVYNIYTNETENFQGEPEQVRRQLMSRYEFLKRYQNQTLQEDIERLSIQQALMVNVEE
jgi:hypothetical protein